MTNTQTPVMYADGCTTVQFSNTVSKVTLVTGDPGGVNMELAILAMPTRELYKLAKHIVKSIEHSESIREVLIQKASEDLKAFSQKYR